MGYFANGTEGMILYEQCDKCLIGVENYCPVALAQMENNYKQICHDKELPRFKGVYYPMVKALLEILVDEKGECQMKLAIEEALKRIENGEQAGQTDFLKD